MYKVIMYFTSYLLIRNIHFSNLPKFRCVKHLNKHTYIDGVILGTRLPVTRWIKLSLNFDSQSRAYMCSFEYY